MSATRVWNSSHMGKPVTRSPSVTYRPADRLAHLAHRVRRLTVDRRDPERFFEDRSEIEAELRRLALEVKA